MTSPYLAWYEVSESDKRAKLKVVDMGSYMTVRKEVWERGERC